VLATMPSPSDTPERRVTAAQWEGRHSDASESISESDNLADIESKPGKKLSGLLTRYRCPSKQAGVDQP